MRCVAMGYTYKDIAVEFGRSRKTVETQISCAMKKLGIHSRSQLMGKLIPPIKLLDMIDEALDKL